MFTQTFKILFLISIILAESVLLKLEPNETVAALIGAVCGGVVLVLFERQKSKTWLDVITKILLSTICSIFLTPAFLKYYNIESWQYINLSFFVMSVIGAFILKTLFQLTKQNAHDVIINFFYRVTNLQPKEVEKKNNG